MDPTIRSIAKKLKAKSLKIATIVNRCELLDRNGDGIIHIGDLESVLVEYLTVDGISRREFANLGRLLAAKSADGSILYHKLYKLFDFDDDVLEGRKPLTAAEDDIWYDPEDVTAYKDAKAGSIGEWLNYSACPAEVRNFKRFIQCLEEFERVSGMKCISGDKGIEVPLGPDLRAKINFIMK